MTTSNLYDRYIESIEQEAERDRRHKWVRWVSCVLSVALLLVGILAYGLCDILILNQPPNAAFAIGDDVTISHLAIDGYIVGTSYRLMQHNVRYADAVGVVRTEWFDEWELVSSTPTEETTDDIIRTYPDTSDAGMQHN